MAKSDTTQLTLSSLNESGRNLSEIDLQPEDQDEALEMSLRSHGNSLVDLYPSMISRIERAWHRHNVSEAAGSVLRRYRRLRQQPNRSYVNSTFIVPMRHSHVKKKTKKEILTSPLKIHATPPLRMVSSLKDWQAQQQSPGRGRGSGRGEHQKPVLVMDFSGSPEIPKPNDILLNETFTVSEQEEQPTNFAASPSRPLCPAGKASMAPSLWSKRLSLSAQAQQTGGGSIYAQQSPAVKERPDIYSSPVRQSPVKAVMMTNLSRSPHTFSRSPKVHSVESYEPVRRRSVSTSLSSPPQIPTVLRSRVHPQDSHLSFQSQLPSPQSATVAARRHRLRRHLSYDSFLPSAQVSSSSKQLDEEFLKLFHRFVCQNKYSVSVPPCRFCARSSEASRGHSSSSLAALALSPHRSLLRKRHKELSWGSNPQSKRSREEYCTSSPGSKRYGNELMRLRRRLSTSESEQSCDGLSYGLSKHRLFPSLSGQHRPAEQHWETWGTKDNESVAELSGLGERHIKKMYCLCMSCLQFNHSAVESFNLIIPLHSTGWSR